MLSQDDIRNALRAVGGSEADLDGQALLGVLTRDHIPVVFSPGQTVSGETIEFRCAENDAPDAARGQTLTVEEQKFVVDDLQRDGRGSLILVLGNRG